MISFIKSSHYYYVLPYKTLEPVTLVDIARAGEIVSLDSMAIFIRKGFYNMACRVRKMEIRDRNTFQKLSQSRGQKVS